LGKTLAEMFDELTTKQRMISLGNEMINRIIKRSQNGFDVFNKKFKPYSTKPKKPYFFKKKFGDKKKTVYVKSYFERKRDGQIKRQASQFKPSSPSNVNLTLTGDMFNSFKVKKATNKNVRIGFTPSESKKAFGNEEMGRVISSVKKPVSTDDEKFITGFYDKIMVKAMKEASGKTEIIIG
tara:strand:- start:3926 stop:4468 length:543 start_codon:yes stop_codon:yes gene_type:complete